MFVKGVSNPPQGKLLVYSQELLIDKHSDSLHFIRCSE
jgi:hypothetical protein